MTPQPTQHCRVPDRDDPDYGDWCQEQVDRADAHIDELIEAGEWAG